MPFISQELYTRTPDHRWRFASNLSWGWAVLSSQLYQIELGRTLLHDTFMEKSLTIKAFCWVNGFWAVIFSVTLYFYSTVAIIETYSFSVLAKCT